MGFGDLSYGVGQDGTVTVYGDDGFGNKTVGHVTPGRKHK